MDVILFQCFFVLITVFIIFSNTVKNQLVKSYSSVFIVILFGIIFITAIFDQPVNEAEPIGIWWLVAWSFIAIGGGIYALKFPEKLLEKNAKYFDKFFSKHGGGKEFRQPYMKPFLLSMSMLFITIGAIQLYLYLPPLLSLLGN